jgi:hypothetical protein
MKKIPYNLARERKIDGRRFARTLGVLLLALAAFNAVTVFNLTRLQRRDRAEQTDSRSAVRLLKTLKEQTRSQQEQIVLMKKAWERPLAAANSLIERKRFSFVARLDFLERACGSGTLVRQLSIVNAPAARVQMTVSALAQNRLLQLYKKLLPYELAIANENQIAGDYLARVSFRIPDEKK